MTICVLSGAGRGYPCRYAGPHGLMTGRHPILSTSEGKRISGNVSNSLSLLRAAQLTLDYDVPSVHQPIAARKSKEKPPQHPPPSEGDILLHSSWVQAMD